MFARPKIVISRCIEHEHCRFDGTMIGSHEVVQLKPYVDFLHYCPEMDIGLPSPRESLKLVRVKEENLLFQSKTGTDRTQDMIDYAKTVSDGLQPQDIDGFILKSRSPSCGIKEVKVYPSIDKSPVLNKSAKGVFAKAMIEHFPHAIFEDEGRLSNFSLREHFYTVIFTTADFKQLKTQPSMKAIVDFHGKNKYLFMAYSQQVSKVLGNIVANHHKQSISQVMEHYELALYSLLIKKPNKGQVINVMLHIFGYFSKELSVTERSYFMETLTSYREGHLPQSTIMKLLYVWAIRFNYDYLLQQSIFEPFPKELVQMLDSGKVV